MIKKLQIATIVPEAIAYEKLKLPLSVSTKTLLSDKLSKSILLKIQGKAFEVSEEYPLPILMTIFGVAHKVSPEMILILKTGERVLLFDHWGMAMLKDKDIITITEAINYKKSEKEFIQELIIDIESIWKEVGAEENDLKAIGNVLKKIKALIKPSMITTLIGETPVLLFLLTQYLLYGQTKEIWYQKNQKSDLIQL